MDELETFLQDLGGLHDSTVTKIVFDATERHFIIGFDDLYSNDVDLPGYKGPKAGQIVFKGVSGVYITMQAENNRVNVYEFCVHRTDTQRSTVSISFWPEGNISLGYQDVELPRIRQISDGD